MKPAPLAGMNKDYIDEDKDFGPEFYEDPEQTIESRGRWVLPILLMVILPVAAIFFLHETSRNSREPLMQAMLNGMPTVRESGAIGTTGRDRSVAESLVVYSLHEIEGISAGSQALVGRKVELRMPVRRHRERPGVLGRRQRQSPAGRADSRSPGHRRAAGRIDSRQQHRATRRR